MNLLDLKKNVGRLVQTYLNSRQFCLVKKNKQKNKKQQQRLWLLTVKTRAGDGLDRVTYCGIVLFIHHGTKFGHYKLKLKLGEDFLGCSFDYCQFW